ncbi:MAG: hypothetical protein EA355_04270 [Rhodobacteraceae bacterium]|nr:MAG: hypothetical protein EA355_04270 [Paracoccaceae bacterium]
MPDRRGESQRVISSLATAGLIAAGLIAALAGCEARGVFVDYPDVESPSVAAAPWPRLVDAPDPAEARATAPDPAEGAAVAEALRIEAALAAAEAERLSAPVFEVGRLRADAAAVRAGR